MLFWKFRFRAATRVYPWRHSTFPPVSPIGAKSAGFGAPGGRDPGFSAAAEHGRRSRSQRPRGAKNLEETKSDLVDLQGLEIAQNRQRNVWIGLEKKGRNWKKLGEKFGEKAFCRRASGLT